ncbi:unnamed protein product [Gulo gulo]|uniref:Uncharacterized protein n=1 Tax=Gulo gulo TaxID=48420 RepID=A0A9X9Q5N5_GULGU|nr:unnamed protein product [Gulo gulo]
MLSQGSNLFSRVICFSAELTLSFHFPVRITLSASAWFSACHKDAAQGSLSTTRLGTSASTHVSVSAVPTGPRPWPARYTPLPE